MHNEPDRFDSISITLHWVIGIAYIGLFALGAYMVTLDYYNPLYTRLPYLHKGLGILLIFVVLFRLVWLMMITRPGPLPTHQRYETIAAGFSAWGMTIGLLIVLASGYLITTAAGAGIDVFDLFTVPALNLDLNNQEDLAGLIHWVTAYLVTGIATIHALAALKHHFVNKDDTLKRMLPRLKRRAEQ